MSGRTAGEIAIATVTLARDLTEEKRLRRSLTALAAQERPAFVCDAGSSDAFVEFLRGLPCMTVVMPLDGGLVGQVRASLSEAARASTRVLYTEPDKVEFFETGLNRFTESAAAADAGCALASRSASAFRGFPRSQQSSENAINRLCGEFLGPEGDYSYGPFLLRSDLVPNVHRVSKELGWGWRHFMFAVAHRLGRPLVHVTGDYECPVDQRIEDEAERLHRLRQLGENVNGLLAGLTVDLAR